MMQNTAAFSPYLSSTVPVGNVIQQVDTANSSMTGAAAGQVPGVMQTTAVSHQKVSRADRLEV